MQLNTANAIFYKQTFNCLVRDRQTVLYEGPASAITTRNEHGLLDVLPEHTHFISIIEGSVDIVRPDGKTLNIPVSKGILKIFGGEARIYLGIFSVASKKK
jgi:F0F1-type ATP synthase epsilon subunit